MRVRNHKLVGNNNKNVPFVSTPNGGGSLKGGKPRYLIMHYTAGATGLGAVEWFENPAAKASAHLVIGHDGDITQMQAFDKVCFHAGKSRWDDVVGLNQYSVGIEIANWGKLSASGSVWRSWTGAVVSSDRVIEAEHKHYPGTQHGWEIFDDEQMAASIEAAQAIVDAYDLEPWQLLGHEDISPLRKVDPGPAFNMDSFRAKVFGRTEDSWNDLLFKVASASELNMRVGQGPGEKLIKNLPDGTVVHVIENVGSWWLVAEVVNGNDDVTGYVHRNWLRPA